MLDADNLSKLKQTLFAGRYNLLVGSGISLDSNNKNGKRLESAETLRKRLCLYKGIASRPLTKVYSTLDEIEIKHIIKLLDGYYASIILVS